MDLIPLFLILDLLLESGGSPAIIMDLHFILFSFRLMNEFVAARARVSVTRALLTSLGFSRSGGKCHRKSEKIVFRQISLTQTPSRSLNDSF